MIVSAIVNYRFNDPKSHEEGKAPYEDIVAAVQKGLLSRDVIVTGPHGSSTPFAENAELAGPHDLPVPAPSAEETVYFQDPFVLVTTSRVVFGKKTFPLRNVTSYRLDVRPANYIIGGILFFFGLVLGVMTVMFAEARVPLFVSAALTVILGILAILMAKSTYHLKVTNAGCETVSTSSNSKSYITKLHAAMNEATVNSH